MPVRTQLTALLPNKPGALARLCEAMSAYQINIIALSVVDTTDQALVRMLCNNVTKAKRVMGNIGIPFGEAQVIALNMPNAPGALAKMARTLTKARVNIDYLYATSAARAGKGTVVLGVSHLERAKKALKL